MNTLAVILGSPFGPEGLAPLALERRPIPTPFGTQVLYRAGSIARAAYVLFRHEGAQLPHHIPYRAMAWALREVGCGALLVVDAFTVVEPGVPLLRPFLVRDLLMPGNRLPDGSPCTLFTQAVPGQGRLSLREGLFSEALTAQVRGLAVTHGQEIEASVVVACTGGPRDSTGAEALLWARLGATGLSTSFGPDVVLANEAGIPCAGLVAGDAARQASARSEVLPSERVRDVLEPLVIAFLRHGAPVPFENDIIPVHPGPNPA